VWYYYRSSLGIENDGHCTHRLRLRLGLELAFVLVQCLECFDAVGWAARKKLSGGVLAWLSVGSEVLTHMAQLMPLPLTVSCFSKIQIGFTFLVPAHPGSPGERAIKRYMCVCVHVSAVGLTSILDQGHHSIC